MGILSVLLTSTKKQMPFDSVHALHWKERISYWLKYSIFHHIIVTSRSLFTNGLFINFVISFVCPRLHSSESWSHAPVTLLCQLVGFPCPHVALCYFPLYDLLTNGLLINFVIRFPYPRVHTVHVHYNKSWSCSIFHAPGVTLLLFPIILLCALVTFLLPLLSSASVTLPAIQGKLQ